MQLLAHPAVECLLERMDSMNSDDQQRQRRAKGAVFSVHVGKGRRIDLSRSILKRLAKERQRYVILHCGQGNAIELSLPSVWKNLVQGLQRSSRKEPDRISLLVQAGLRCRLDRNDTIVLHPYLWDMGPQPKRVRLRVATRAFRLVVTNGEQRIPLPRISRSIGSHGFA